MIERILPNAVNDRLDRIVARAFAMSRGAAARAVKGGRITVNGAVVPDADARFEGALTLGLDDELTPGMEQPTLPVVHQDGDCIVIDKPAGLIVYPAGSNVEPSVVGALLAAGVSLGGGAPERPGVVHRLDRDTSGLLVLAKTAAAHEALVQAFRTRTVEKIYEAVVVGTFDHEEGVIDAPIRRTDNPLKRTIGNGPQAKEARTDFRVLEQFVDAAHLELRPKTGRTHQLRVHLSSIGHSILGDRLYPASKTPTLTADRTLLHARALRFAHPRTGKPVAFDAPLPADIRAAIDALRSARNGG